MPTDAAGDTAPRIEYSVTPMAGSSHLISVAYNGSPEFHRIPSIAGAGASLTDPALQRLATSAEKLQQQLSSLASARLQGTLTRALPDGGTIQVLPDSRGRVSFVTVTMRGRTENIAIDWAASPDGRTTLQTSTTGGVNLRISSSCITFEPSSGAYTETPPDDPDWEMTEECHVAQLWLQAANLGVISADLAVAAAMASCITDPFGCIGNVASADYGLAAAHSNQEAAEENERDKCCHMVEVPHEGQLPDLVLMCKPFNP